MVSRKRALGIKAGRLAQEEWNLAAIELEPTTCPWGNKQRESVCLLLGQGGPQSQMDMKKWPQIAKPHQPPKLLDLDQPSSTWGSGVHRKLKECKGREERERMQAI